MIWHIVRFDFAGVDDAVREELEDQLRGLEVLDCVGFLRLGRDVEEPSVTGLLTGFAGADELTAYRTDPDHVSVVEAIRRAGVGTIRLDVETSDDPTSLA